MAKIKVQTFFGGSTYRNYMEYLAQDSCNQWLNAHQDHIDILNMSYSHATTFDHSICILYRDIKDDCEYCLHKQHLERMYEDGDEFTENFNPCLRCVVYLYDDGKYSSRWKRGTNG